eukprot:663031-Amphidinium_carterae.1
MSGILLEGGAPISDSNLLILQSKLSEIRATHVRVVFVGGTQQDGRSASCFFLFHAIRHE